VVDAALVAAKLAMIRDTVTRIGSVLPADLQSFQHNRTAREVVTLNLFVGIQECVSLASHVLADEGWGTPKTYGESFAMLAEHGVLSERLTARLRAAAGLRNLLAHQYGAVDVGRLYEFAATHRGDLTEFCSSIATWANR
jgi:uncharacterized protein YutE (UPF0331/DUF86 family)